MKLSKFGQCRNEVNPNGKNNFAFPTFLSVVEILIYYVCMGLGLFCVYKVVRDPSITEDPFEPIASSQDVEMQ